MMYDPVQSLKADRALAEILMPVLCRIAWILAVIDMKNGDLIFSDHPVKLLQHAVKILHKIIPGIVCMAGIKTDAQLLVVYHPIINRRELLKAPSDLRALTGHRFQGNIAWRITA